MKTVSCQTYFGMGYNWIDKNPAGDGDAACSDGTAQYITVMYCPAGYNVVGDVVERCVKPR